MRMKTEKKKKSKEIQNVPRDLFLTRLILYFVVCTLYTFL